MNRKWFYSVSMLALGLTLAITAAKAHVQLPRGTWLLPTAVEDRALKIFNGVSPQARAWILDEARACASGHHWSLDSIRSDANRRFGGTHPLTAFQQNEFALAVLDQVMKLDEQERSRLTAIPASRRPVADDESPKKGRQDKASPKSEAAKSSNSTTSAELECTTNEYKEAQRLAESVLKGMGDSRDSVVGKL